MVRDEERSRKSRVILERKITWSANSREDGGFIVSKAARRRNTDQVGRLEVMRCRRLVKIAVSLWA
jgi:hypothetical protein